jgi:hypothetical protein
MSSQIDSQNIDQTFPVAGQDNNSQGFRDNFTAIQQNFEFAKAELEDLQSKALLKSALDGSALNNDLGGSNISNGNYTNFHGTSYSQTVTTSANIDVLNGSLQTFTLTGDTTFTFTNWPDSGNYALVRAHFVNNGSIVNVGNDIEIGRRYTIDQVGTTNFIAMGATPTVVFSGSIAGSTLTVSGILTGITVGTVLTGTGVSPGTRIIATNAENPNLTGTGGSGTYTVDASQTVSSTQMQGMTSGVTFTVGESDSLGSGTGTVKPWKTVILNSENTGTITGDSSIVFPLELNPDGSNQVIEAWTWTGSTSKKIYVSYVGTLGTEDSNFLQINAGSVTVNETTSSTSVNTGALRVSGGVGVGENLNVGGDLTVVGDIRVTGGSIIIDSNNLNVTVAELNEIGDVVITNAIPGDALKFNGVNWTNNVDLIEYDVRVEDNGSGAQEVFFLNNVALADDTGNQLGLRFAVGKKYRFNLSDASNAAAPLRFSTTPDISVPDSITEYTDNVYIGSAYIEILVTAETPSPLYLYGFEADPGIDTSLIGAAYPIQVGNGPVLVLKDYTPVGSQDILVDSSEEAITITLPANSTERPLAYGTRINIVDNGNAGVNNITIQRETPVTINGLDQNYVLSGSFGSVSLVYGGANNNWTLINNGYNGGDDATPGNITTGTCKIDTSVTYFSTVGTETATLGAGVEGQIKVLLMKGNGGTMTVTVTNAGWKVGGGSGTIVFDTVGDACTLQYVEDKWYVIGNQGCECDFTPAEIIDPPNSANATGKAGQLAYDTSFLYVCVAANTWKSVPFTSTFQGGFNEGSSSINDLSDVATSGNISGQVLKWNGAAWTNQSDAT